MLGVINIVIIKNIQLEVLKTSLQYSRISPELVEDVLVHVGPHSLHRWIHSIPIGTLFLQFADQILHVYSASLLTTTGDHDNSIQDPHWSVSRVVRHAQEFNSAQLLAT